MDKKGFKLTVSHWAASLLFPCLWGGSWGTHPSIHGLRVPGFTEGVWSSARIAVAMAFCHRLEVEKICARGY